MQGVHARSSKEARKEHEHEIGVQEAQKTKMPKQKA